VLWWAHFGLHFLVHSRTLLLLLAFGGGLLLGNIANCIDVEGATLWMAFVTLGTGSTSIC